MKGFAVEEETGPVPDELPEELRKFRSCMDAGVPNMSKAKYSRRGMRNEANNCYMNVVIQSLLPVSALMQLLSFCSPHDGERPFYTCLVKLCREFHSRKSESNGDALNVLALPEVRDIISEWRSIGAQQDAGEFLFYMLSGMHEECKWKVSSDPSLSSPPARQVSCDSTTSDDDWAALGRRRKVSEEEIRSAGLLEDSPIVRIFGGMIRSSVRMKASRADSVSLEPFNHLTLDITPPNIDSVWKALEAYCLPEAVNEGKATKRLQFKTTPKVLILNLKRFTYNMETGCPQKVKKPVRFDEKLVFDRSWLVDDGEPQEYSLTAVICHHGESANGGHYNSAVRYNGEWFMYDDAIVRPISLPEVSSMCHTAYLLVYQCSDRVDISP